MKYAVVVMDTKTGQAVRKPLYCDGFAVMTFKGGIKENGVHERVNYWVRDTDKHELACGMYTADKLREAMWYAARKAPWYAVKQFFKRVRQRLKGRRA